MKFFRIDDKIPAEIWFEAITPLLREGYRFKISPQGRSMVPFLQGGRDEAVLFAPDGEYLFKKNDVVLFKSGSGIHILHRICRVTKNGIYTLGDGNTEAEGPFRREDILAVAEYIIRKGKTIRNDDRRYILLVNIWRMIRPFRPFVVQGYLKMRRLEYKMRKR